MSSRRKWECIGQDEYANAANPFSVGVEIAAQAARGAQVTHGGKRPGAGRPVVIPKDERVDLRVTVHTKHAQALDRWAESQGYRDRSEAVRAWLDTLP